MSGPKVMLCPASSGPYLENLARELRAQGVRVTLIPWFGKQTPYSMIRIIWSRLLGYRILHLNWMPFNNFWQLRLVTRVGKILGIRVVWTIHNLAPHSVQFGSPERDEAAMQILFEWAERGVVHSERTREAVRMRYGNTLPLEVIPHGSYAGQVELVDSVEARRRLGIPEDKFAVLMLGPNRWNKGVRAYLEVISRLPDGYVGVVAGTCPDSQILNLIQEYKERFPDKFILDVRRLSVGEVAEHYAASDILLMPFEAITTSGTVIEALSYSRPVITTDKGDMYEWIHDGETGFMASSIDDMVSILKSLDREKARRMGQNGLALAKKRPWPESARQYADIYRELQ